MPRMVKCWLQFQVDVCSWWCLDKEMDFRKMRQVLYTRGKQESQSG